MRFRMSMGFCAAPSSPLGGSTAHASELGDARWRELLAAHDDATRGLLARYDGREVKRTGDGFLATFDGPARAIRCAIDLVEALDRIGIEVRVGVHTGECEIMGEDLGGITVHVGARVADYAAPGEILVSSTVRDLVAGSGIRFGEARLVELKGLPGTREVLSVLRLGTSPTTVRRMASAHESVFRREGEYWTLAYAGNVVTLRDTKGMHDLAVLLARPGQEVHALDLARAAEGVACVAADADRGIEVIDERARDEYRDRLAAIEQELEDTRSFGDETRAAKLREEAEAVTEELAAAYGLGGRSRTTGDAERARKAVGRRVRDALERIERAHPPLGAHLRAAVKLGTFCSYEPETAVAWALVESGISSVAGPALVHPE